MFTSRLRFFYRMFKRLFMSVMMCAAISSGMASEPVFKSMVVPDSVRERMDGKSYSDGCPVKMDDLRYLKISHYDFAGEIRVGEMVCHKDIADKLVNVFRVLFMQKYPIEKIRLIDEYGGDDEASMRDNNTSCFNFRTVAGSKKLSRHAYGKAVDINPLYNPYVRVLADGKSFIQPSTAEKFVKRDKRKNPYMINRTDAAYIAFRDAGFKWGGNWRRYKDYQHFSY